MSTDSDGSSPQKIGSKITLAKERISDVISKGNLILAAQLEEAEILAKLENFVEGVASCLSEFENLAQDPKCVEKDIESLKTQLADLREVQANVIEMTKELRDETKLKIRDHHKRSKGMRRYIDDRPPGRISVRRAKKG